MRIPIFVTLLLLAALVGIGWHNQHKIANLRSTGEKLAAQAATRGIFLDDTNTIARTRMSKRPRPDHIAEAKRIAGEFIAYAKDMEALGFDAPQQRMIDQMDQIMALNGAQLKILIEEIFTHPDIDNHMQRDLVDFTIQLLTKDHPQEALAILTDSSGLLELLKLDTSNVPQNRIGNATYRWASTNPSEALTWYRKNSDRLSFASIKWVEGSLVRGIADSDLRLALELHGEFEMDAWIVPALITRGNRTSAERISTLPSLREWSATIADEKVKERTFCSCLVTVALRRGKDSAAANFEATMQRVKDANLSSEELGLLFTRVDLVDLSAYINPEETDQWIEWLGKTFPSNSHRLWQLSQSTSTKTAVEQWLITAPDSPAKHSIIRNYAEATVTFNPPSAVHWALNLPDGPDRDQTLQRLYERWPKSDPPSKAAADAFAKEHGIIPQSR